MTTIARALVDLTDVLTAHQLAYVIKEAAYRKRFDLAATRRAMDRANGRRNLHVLEKAIELYEHGSAGTKSPHEDAFLALVTPTLPEPLVNTPLAGFEVDFLWPEAMLVVEIDGGGHERPPARARTTSRTACCVARATRCCASRTRISPSTPRTCSRTSARR